MPAAPSASNANLNDKMSADTLLFNIVSYICGMGGRVFGKAVRRLLLHSFEPVAEIDCMFRRPACADKFVAILGIEHALTVLEIEPYGVYRYNVQRQGIQLALRVHAYDLENRSDKHVNARLLEPCFDIDHIFWDDRGVFEVDRSSKRQCAGGPTPQASPIGAAMSAVMHRRFCVVNPLATRSPAAMCTMLAKAEELVRSSYVHDQSRHLYLACPLVCLEDGFHCSIMDAPPEGPEEPANAATAVAHLPCGHAFSIEGVRMLLSSTPPIVACPTCSNRFCPPERGLWQ